jgi:acetyltransferase-like isoleucine patch superfamily enzyme
MGIVSRIWRAIDRRIAQRSSEGYVAWLRRQGVTVGTGTQFHGIRDIVIDLTRPCLIEIGNNVVLTRGVTLLTHGFDWMVLRNLYHEVLASSGRITIEDNVFIGMHAVILKGVRIGRNTIIGAGSVVTRDIPENSVAAGNPARVLCSIDQYYRKRKASYIEEAKLYAQAIKENLHRDPVPGDFWEEFPLFLKADALPADIPVQRQLGPSYASYRNNQTPVYASFEDFLADAGIPAKTK